MSQAIADRLHEEARCWPWRRALFLDRLCELENIADDTEQALIPCAGEGAIRDRVFHLGDLIVNAYHMLGEGEHDYAETACERVEHALIDLRRTARAIGAIT
jgi:hypothetical protein